MKGEREMGCLGWSNLKERRDLLFENLRCSVGGPTDGQVIFRKHFSDWELSKFGKKMKLFFVLCESFSLLILLVGTLQENSSIGKYK
jgi:hypothetical protein